MNQTIHGQPIGTSARPASGEIADHDRVGAAGRSREIGELRRCSARQRFQQYSVPTVETQLGSKSAPADQFRDVEGNDVPCARGESPGIDVARVDGSVVNASTSHRAALVPRRYDYWAARLGQRQPISAAAGIAAAEITRYHRKRAAAGRPG